MYAKLSRFTHSSGPLRLCGVGRVRWLLKALSIALGVYVFISTLTELLAVRAWINAQRSVEPPLDPCEALESHSPMLAQSSLPRIIHQMWPKGKPMPAHTDRWFKKWDELFPDWEHRLWSDDDLVKLIETEYAWFMPFFTWYPFNIMRIDAARTFVLHRFGGLYADMDYEPLADFWNRLSDRVPSLIESSWTYERHQNSFMSSPRGHVFWNHTWAAMMDRVTDSKARSAILVPLDTVRLTGPQLIDEAVRRYSKALPDYPVRTMSCQNFARFTVGFQMERGTAADRLRHQNAKDGVFRRCGSVLDCRCQLGLHHSTTMWKDP